MKTADFEKMRHDLARSIDISAVRAQSTLVDVETTVEAAKKYGFICVFPMPSFLEKTKTMLKGFDHIGLGGVVAFPSGAETTEIKVLEAMSRVQSGCAEVDMVMNIGKLKSGLYKEVLDDILAVRKTVTNLPLKVIIEVALLDDKEIVEASKIVLESGADYLKTGTGWAGATTFNHLDCVFATVGKNIKVKVAGGVRDLDTLTKMRDMGVCRFGIGAGSAIKIMEEFEARYGGELA